MGKLFGGGPSAPAPPPQAPIDDERAKQAQLDAQKAALAERRGSGRGSTIVAGAQIAFDEQSGRALMSQRRRMGAAQDVLG